MDPVSVGVGVVASFLTILNSLKWIHGQFDKFAKSMVYAAEEAEGLGEKVLELSTLLLLIEQILKDLAPSIRKFIDRGKPS